MKRFLTMMLLLCSLTTASWADGDEGDEVELTAEIIKDDPVGNDFPRSPIQVPSASINDHTFYISGSHPDYVFQLVDIDGGNDVVYDVPMYSGMNSIVIPSIYSGNYRVQLIWGNWCFWGYICL